MLGRAPIVRLWWRLSDLVGRLEAVAGCPQIKALETEAVAARKQNNCLNWEEMKLKQIQTISQSRNASIDLWSLRCITWVHFCYSHIVTTSDENTMIFQTSTRAHCETARKPEREQYALLLHVTLTDCWTSCCSAPVWMTMGWPGCLPCICAWMACSCAWVSWI